MILVKRQPDTTTQKVVATFLKRVKKSGLTGRVRKTLNWIKPKSKLLQKQKAIRIFEYNKKAELMERMGKKAS
jgi:hypothetical protein